MLPDHTIGSSDHTRMAIPLWHFVAFDGQVVGSANPAALPMAEKRVRAVADTYSATTIVCLTERPPSYAADGLALIHCPVAGVHDTDGIMAAGDEVAQRLRAGEVVWVHCQQGLDRTACVLASAMMRCGWSRDAVVAELRARIADRLADPRRRDLWEATTAAVIQAM